MAELEWPSSTPRYTSRARAYCGEKKPVGNFAVQFIEYSPRPCGGRFSRRAGGFIRVGGMAVAGLLNCELSGNFRGVRACSATAGYAAGVGIIHHANRFPSRVRLRLRLCVLRRKFADVRLHRPRVRPRLCVSDGNSQTFGFVSRARSVSNSASREHAPMRIAVENSDASVCVRLSGLGDAGGCALGP